MNPVCNWPYPDAATQEKADRILILARLDPDPLNHNSLYGIILSIYPGSWSRWSKLVWTAHKSYRPGQAEKFGPFSPAPKILILGIVVWNFLRAQKKKKKDILIETTKEEYYTYIDIITPANPSTMDGKVILM